MKRKPKRSYETDLSDDDLILLDAILVGNFFVEDLFRANFKETTDFDYCHTLSDEAVIKTIDTFAMRKFVILRRNTDNKFSIALNDAGMKVWDDERHPDWDAYCNHQMAIDVDEDGNEIWSVTAYSPSLELVDEFMDAAIECHLLFDVQRDQKKVEHLTDVIWWGWVEFPNFYHVTFPCGPIDEEVEVNWDLYEKHRTWWSDPMELGGLQTE